GSRLKLQAVSKPSLHSSHLCHGVGPKGPPAAAPAMAAPGVPAAPARSPQPAGTEAVADELGVGQMPGRDVARVSAQGGVRRAGAGAAEDAVDSEAVEVKLEVGAASGWAADVEDPCAKPTGVVEATSATRACARPKA
ncbi:unnamed protein product, partial [Prorocentrum cordatum]